MIGFYSAGAMGQGGAPPASDFPEVLSITATMLSGSFTADKVVNLGTYDAGDLLLLVMSYNYVSTGVFTPAGWTSLYNTGPSGPAQVAVFSRVATGSEGASVTVSSDGTRAQAHVIRIKAGTYGSVHLTQVNSSSFAVAGITCPTLTPAGGSGKILWLAFGYGRGTRDVSAYPLANGQTNTRDSVSNTNRCTLATCWANVEAASLSPGDYDWIGVQQSGAITLAVRPA